MTKQKRCRRCRHFLAAAWKHRLCRACRKLLSKVTDPTTTAIEHAAHYRQIIEEPQYAPMGKIHDTITEPEPYHIRFNEKHLKKQVKLTGVRVTKNPIKEKITIDNLGITIPPEATGVFEKREVYEGKKQECGYCGEMTYLYSTKKSSKKLCKSCKSELENMGIKITGKCQIPDVIKA